MKKVVWLRDIKHIPTPRSFKDRPEFPYSAEIMERCRVYHENRGLRYNTVTGVVYDCDGWLSRPSGYTPDQYADESEVMLWQFLSFIANSASRVSCGYSM